MNSIYKSLLYNVFNILFPESVLERLKAWSLFGVSISGPSCTVYKIVQNLNNGIQSFCSAVQLLPFDSSATPDG